MPKVDDKKRLKWINLYLRLVEDTEPPKIFKVWAAIGGVAQALQRRVWIQWGTGRIYPNMYIVLVGPSGLGKTQALNPVSDVLYEAGVKIAPEAITREELVNYMEASEDQFKDPSTGKLINHSSVQIIAKEFASLVGRKNMDLLSWLTDWYDCDRVWRYGTKTSGHNEVHGVCMNIIAGTTRDHLQNMLPIEAIGGGFTSRIIFIYATKRSKLIPIPQNNIEVQKIKKSLVKATKRLMKMAGPFSMTADAEDVWTSYYIYNAKCIENGNLPVQDAHFLGYASRRTLHLIKLSMIISASRSSDMVIQKQDIEFGIKLLKSAEQNMAAAFGGIGTSELAQIVQKLYDYALSAKIPSRQGFMLLYPNDADMETVEKAESHAVHIGLIKISIRGAHVFYEPKERS